VPTISRRIGKPKQLQQALVKDDPNQTLMDQWRRQQGQAEQRPRFSFPRLQRRSIVMIDAALAASIALIWFCGTHWGWW
jgi:hypothetical protein